MLDLQYQTRLIFRQIKTGKLGQEFGLKASSVWPTYDNMHSYILWPPFLKILIFFFIETCLLHERAEKYFFARSRRLSPADLQGKVILAFYRQTLT